MNHDTTSKPPILVVDDEELNLALLSDYLREDYSVFTAFSGYEALQKAEELQPELILMDIEMPGMTGLEAALRLKENILTATIPIIYITAHDDPLFEAKCFEYHAVDFIAKPLDAKVVQARVGINLKMTKGVEFKKSQDDVLHCLLSVLARKDIAPESYIHRIQFYAEIFADALNFSSARTQQLQTLAAIHDIGKIVIPDSILFKTGRLTVPEHKTIQQHTIRGFEILNAYSTPLLALAAKISLTHHENWDGSGYPYGLKHEVIPLESRIISIIDVFDSLATKQAYRPALNRQQAGEWIITQSGKKFDPQLIEVFSGILRDLNKTPH